MPRIVHLFYYIRIATVFTFGTPAICAWLTLTFGDLCWPQRIGSVYIGTAVFLQGFIAADPGRFVRKFSDGTTLQKHINQQSFFAAVFGTFFAAFGDLMPINIYYGVSVCHS